MSTPENASADPPRAKSKRKLLLLVGAPVLLVGVFVGGLFAAKAGLVPGLQPAAPEPDLPKLQFTEKPGPHGPRLKTAYMKLPGEFTTNLAGSSRLVQIELGVATHYDERVFQAVTIHELAIRSVVIGVLAQQSEMAVSSTAGRAALQRQLKAALNALLVEKEGFGGISDVYFSSLVIQ